MYLECLFVSETLGMEHFLAKLWSSSVVWRYLLMHLWGYVLTVPCHGRNAGNETLFFNQFIDQKGNVRNGTLDTSLTIKTTVWNEHNIYNVYTVPLQLRNVGNETLFVSIALKIAILKDHNILSMQVHVYTVTLQLWNGGNGTLSTQLPLKDCTDHHSICILCTPAHVIRVASATWGTLAMEH